MIAQSKRQQGEFTETKLVLTKVLELQISTVQELQGGITAGLRNDTKNKSDKKFKCELVKLFQPKNTLEHGKTQAQINVKDVQKASNRAKRIKCLEHQVEAAQVNVLDPKPGYSNQMKKVIAKAAVISSGKNWKQITTYLYLFCMETSNQQSRFLCPRYRLSTIWDVPG